MARQETAMELAFQRLPVSALSTKLGNTIFDCLIRRAKGHKKAHHARGWSTNLSYRTYRSLAAKGVLQ